MYVVCTHKNRLGEAILMSIYNTLLFEENRKEHHIMLLYLALQLIPTGSNYCLEQIFIVPKVFEPLKFDYILNPQKGKKKAKPHPAPTKNTADPWPYHELVPTGCHKFQTLQTIFGYPTNPRPHYERASFTFGRRSL